MGYTHFYQTKKKLGTQKQWNAFTADVNKIIEATDIPLANGHGELGTSPIVNKSIISLNGVEDDSYETLYIELVSTARMEKGDKLTFNFCKTVRKPYDVIVVAVLVALKHHFPATQISSDGNHDKWQEGIDLVKKVLDYGSDFLLDS